MKVIGLDDMLRGEGFVELVEQYDGVELDRCPLAYVGGDPQCVEPRVMPWLGRVHGAARGVTAGIGLQMYEPSPTEALLDAVASLKASAEAAASWDARMRE